MAVEKIPGAIVFPGVLGVWNPLHPANRYDFPAPIRDLGEIDVVREVRRQQKPSRGDPGQVLDD